MWLRDHFHNFVYPAFTAACTQDNPTSDDIGRPERFWAKEDSSLPGELAKLKGLCAWHQKTWNPKRTTYASYERGKLHFDLIKRSLLSAEAQRRDHKCTRLLFAGRDVWPFEVMARKRGIPSVYMPEMSRMVACNFDFGKRAILSLFEKYGIALDEPVLMIDTGYAGTIVRAVGDAVGHPIKFALMSQRYKTNLLPLNSFPDRPELIKRSSNTDWWNTIQYGTPRRKVHSIDPNNFPNQLFPNRKKARQEVLDTEYLPKYFKTGTLREGKVIQYLGTAEDIIGAAVLTSDIWRGVKERAIEM